MVEQYELVLERGTKGLGFNIIGGTDIPRLRGDFFIYVSKIKPEGSAALDGRLQVGDKILSVNGESLVNVKHQEAVNKFINCGQGEIRMVIEKKSTQTSSGGFGRFMKYALPVLVVGVVVAVLVIRNRT